MEFLKNIGIGSIPLSILGVLLWAIGHSVILVEVLVFNCLTLAALMVTWMIGDFIRHDLKDYWKRRQA